MDVGDRRQRANYRRSVLACVNWLRERYADKVREHLYERSAESMQIRAEANSRLRRAVREIWHFAYDVALVDYLDNRRQLVSLGSKTKIERHRPYFALAQAGELFPPLAPV